MNTPTERLEAFNINYDHLARIMEAKRSQPTSTIRPTMTYRVDASREQMPKPKPITLHAPRWAVNY
jgi:hypothetical protein